MRLAVDSEGAYNEPTRAQLMISHPNDSGLAMDQLTRFYTPAYFVRSVKVSYAGRPVLASEVDFSISENPYFRFYFVPSGEGELKAEAVDTKDLRFEPRFRCGAAQAARRRPRPNDYAARCSASSPRLNLLMAWRPRGFSAGRGRTPRSPARLWWRAAVALQ
jgi:hypothetical protein